MTTTQAPWTVLYRNHAGVVAVRRLYPRRVWFGVTEWHPEPQWLLDGWDVDRQAERTYALRDFLGAPPEDATDPQSAPEAPEAPEGQPEPERASGSRTGARVDAVESGDPLDAVRVTARGGDEVTVWLPEYTYLDTVAWSVEVGIPRDHIPGLITALQGVLDGKADQ